MRWLVGIVALVVAGVLVAASLFTSPPPVRRFITFRVAPQVLGRVDSPLEEWRWSWSEDPGPGVRGDLSDHWPFFASRRNEG